MLRAGVRQKFKDIEHCWTDTLCIDQSSDDDKHRQIPLMGRIFGDAAAVLILLRTALGLDQAEVDRFTELLQPAVKMDEEETWQEHGQYWQSGDGRNLIVTGMRGIARLTRTAWTTRVWTLQEYILARQVVWIGTDLRPVVVLDVLFAALPDICDTLLIEECLGEEFQKIYSFFSGMANTRLRRGDRTRVMELLGNRSASIPADEVYGVMAASDVEIPSRAGMHKEDAWQLWCEEAVRKGHVRWLLMPAVLDGSAKSSSPKVNCAFPAFNGRHKASASSGLDSVSPLGATSVANGTCEVSGRWIGACKLMTKLGTVHEPTPNRIHRDITLILFAKGRWQRAYLVALVFGAGRYSERQLRLIARTLVTNFWRCRKSVCNRSEDTFKPRFSDQSQRFVWSDFMELQMSQMPPINDGIAYLAQIGRAGGQYFHAVIVLGDCIPDPGAYLDVVDMGARTNSGRCVFLVLMRPSTTPDQLKSGPSSSLGLVSGNDGSSAIWETFTFHKAAVTLPVSDDIGDTIMQLPLTRFKIGGQSCWYCGANASGTASHSARGSSTKPCRRSSARDIKRRASDETQVIRLLLKKTHLQQTIRLMRQSEVGHRGLLRLIRRKSRILSNRLGRMAARLRAVSASL